MRIRFALGWLALAGLIITVITACDSPGIPCAQVQSKIKSVGGCDRNGYCSVILEDGTEWEGISYPVAGGTLHGDYCWQRK